MFLLSLETGGVGDVVSIGSQSSFDVSSPSKWLMISGENMSSICVDHINEVIRIFMREQDKMCIIS